MSIISHIMYDHSQVTKAISLYENSVTGLDRLTFGTEKRAQRGLQYSDYNVLKLD